MNIELYLNSLEQNIKDISDHILKNCSDINLAEIILNNLLTLFRFCTQNPGQTNRVLERNNASSQRFYNILSILALIYQGICEVPIEQKHRATLLSDLCAIERIYINQHGMKNICEQPNELINSCSCILQKLKQLKLSLQSSVHNDYALKKIIQHISKIIDEVDIFNTSLKTFGCVPKNCESKIQFRNEQICILLNTFSRNKTLKEETDNVLSKVYVDFMELKKKSPSPSIKSLKEDKEILIKNNEQLVQQQENRKKNRTNESVQKKNEETLVKAENCKTNAHKLPLCEISNININNYENTNQNKGGHQSNNQKALLKLFSSTGQANCNKNKEKQEDTPKKDVSSVKGYIVSYDPEEDVNSFRNTIQQSPEYPFLNVSCSGKSSLKVKENPNFEEERKAILESDKTSDLEEYDDELEKPFSPKLMSKRAWMKLKLETLFQKIFDTEKRFKESGNKQI